jgi:hypothetical protein
MGYEFELWTALLQSRDAKTMRPLSTGMVAVSREQIKEIWDINRDLW